MKKIFLVAVLVGVATIGQAAFWRCDLPGGVYTVSLPAISSVSTHEYIVDGAARVTELTVSTTGAVVARFYYLQPLVPKSPIGVGQSVIDKVQERVQDVAGRVEGAGVEPFWKKVVKNYPTATHAHTVEYRLDNLDDIEKSRKSLDAAWRNNTETAIKIRE